MKVVSIVLDVLFCNDCYCYSLNIWLKKVIV